MSAMEVDDPHEAYHTKWHYLVAFILLIKLLVRGIARRPYFMYTLYQLRLKTSVDNWWPRGLAK